MRFSLVMAALVSTAAFGQTGDGFLQIGYAANLNIGDSVLNLSYDGLIGGVGSSFGNLCVNIYVFDPQEEEIGCCACLVSANGLNSLSVKNDLISNNLTPAVPTSVVIKLLSTLPDETKQGSRVFTVCNPATAGSFPSPTGTGDLLITKGGMLAWGTTLEPSSTPGTYNAVNVQYLNASFAPGFSEGPTGFGPPGHELTGLTSLCNFIQANGTGFGICKSCRLGALGGSKQ